jgi:hypothetical protein
MGSAVSSTEPSLPSSVIRASSVEPRLGRGTAANAPCRPARRRGHNLPVGKVLNVTQDEDFAVGFGQAGGGLHPGGVFEFAQHDPLRRTGLGSLGDLPQRLLERDRLWRPSTNRKKRIKRFRRRIGPVFRGSKRPSGVRLRRERPADAPEANGSRAYRTTAGNSRVRRTLTPKAHTGGTFTPPKHRLYPPKPL